ncbi:hypothetical protein GKQ23_04100 [Erwinia sp. E602]|uniref:restriction endonuclease subunit S n=1 Tax=Erwinia sp. E602 TaxID=2675378 RepID=UPI001BA81B56|nr:restriction endonuclease subunit S [Erwinia sp. E602]QUG74229.1 hypothetical protein GKQ23_04100 [Erwinia sp. E602]
MSTKKRQSFNFSEIAMQSTISINRDDNPYDKYVEGGHIESNTLKIRKWGVFGDQYVGPAFHRVFKKGQILYCSRRTYLKKVAVPHFDGITSNTTFVIEPKVVDGFIPQLLPFIMLSSNFTQHSVLYSKGSTNPYINYKDLEGFEFSLPGVAEQNKILNILNKIQGNEHALVDSISSLIKLNDVLLSDSLKKSAPSLPLSKLLTETKRSVSDLSSASKHIGFEHINSDDLFVRECEEVSQINSHKSLFEYGDILYGKIRPYLRKVALSNMEGVCSSDILVLRPEVTETAINIAWYLKSTYFSNVAMSSAKGSKMPRADWNVLQKHTIPASFLDEKYTKIAKAYYDQLSYLNEQLRLTKELQISLTDRLLG